MARMDECLQESVRGVPESTFLEPKISSSIQIECDQIGSYVNAVQLYLPSLLIQLSYHT